MDKFLKLAILILSVYMLSACTLISTVATSQRMESARLANEGKQLVPKDGGTYLIPIGTETVSYLGSGDTDFKINNTSFTQPKGTYSIIKISPNIYNIYANKRVIGGGEASAPLDIKQNEAICFYVFNPISGPARIENYKGDACDPFIRKLKNQNIIGNIN